MPQQAMRQNPVFVDADPEAIRRAQDYLREAGIALISVSHSSGSLRLFVNSDAIAKARQETGAITEDSLLQLRMLSCGMTNAEIGDKLGKSENTVKASLKALYRTIGAHDRAHAVLIACRTGLI